MLERHQPTQEEISRLPYTEYIEFSRPDEWVIINDSIGLAINQNRGLLILCDKRMRVERDGINHPPPGIPEIGLLLLPLAVGRKLFITKLGDESPLVIERVIPLNFLRVLKAHHTSPISLEHTDLSTGQMSRRLAANLRS